LFVTKSGDLSQFQLSVVDHPKASATAFSLAHGFVASFTGAEAPEHAPHFALSIALYRQFSVLRI
jgi:hypothetical protein